ncbi:hypothetical protein DS421_2g49220 [Arachis hypogaea]|nr:hypothetical protein DS421_2g49220 [Arachis hypogaea]
MDCDNNENGAKEPWDWHRNDCNLKKNSNFGQDISEDLWNDMPQNDEYISYMFEDEEATPVKACGDLGYGVNDSVLDDVQKEVEELRETSSQVKRRRMLQFNIQDSDHSLSSEEMSLAYLKSDEEVDSLMDPFPEVSEWVPGSSEYALGDLPASSYEDLESTEGWLAECLNDAAMQFSPDELNFSGAEDIQIDIAGIWHLFSPFTIVSPVLFDLFLSLFLLSYLHCIFVCLKSSVTSRHLQNKM